MTRDLGLDTLLLLNGESIEQQGGHWVKFAAHRVDETPARPHGIRYSLTLHDRYGNRVLGFDNAHAVKPPKRAKYAGRRIDAHDHQHRTRSDKGVPYAFTTPEQLVADFWKAVDEYFEQGKRR